MTVDERPEFSFRSFKGRCRGNQFLVLAHGCRCVEAVFENTYFTFFRFQKREKVAESCCVRTFSNFLMFFFKIQKKHDFTFFELLHAFSQTLSPHLYADDTQVYGSCAPTAVALHASQISECVDAVAAWVKSNRLQLNPAKTEVLWCATSRRRHQLPTTAMQLPR